jgi:Aspartyl protease
VRLVLIALLLIISTPSMAREYKPSTVEDTQVFIAMPMLAYKLYEKITVPLERSPQGNHFILKINMNGQGPYNFLLDTGASALFISKRVVKEVQPQLILNLETNINKHRYETRFYRFDTIEFGGATLFEYDGFYVVDDDVQERMGDAIGMRLDGVIGFGAFYHYLFTVDLSHDQIELVSGELSEDMEGVVRFNDDLRVPRMMLTFEDDKDNKLKANMLVDSGHFSSLQLPPGNDSLPFAIDEQSPVVGIHMQGLREGHYAQIDAYYYFGRYKISKPRVIYGIDHHSKHGMIGTKTLRDYKVTFDQKNDLLLIEKTENKD